MEVKAGYKQTEIGVIPEDWDLKPLDTISFVTSGKRMPLGKSLVDSETPHPYIRVTDMRMGTVSTSDLKFVPVDVFPAIKRYRIFKDDIFISVAGTLGIVGKIPLELDGANLTENADRITNITCSRNYLLHFLMSPTIQNTIEAIQTVGAQPKLALTRIRKFDIPVPPTLAEQEAIAEALSDADALIEVLEQLLTKKRQVKQGAMQELLTGKKRLPGFLDDWKIIELREIVIQFIVPMRDKPKIFRGEIPWCRIEDFDGKVLFGSKSDQKVDNEIVKQMNLKVYPVGTLLVSCSADLGRCAIIGRPLVSNQTFIGLVFDEDKASNDYFYYYMTYHAEELNNLSSGTTISYLSREQFEAFKVRVPTTKTEQTAISEILSDMDAEIATLEGKLSKARQVKAGMMSVLLTGKVRLV